ncbi:S8 family serine peptidase [Microcoleus sp. ARI1-B5]|uniref:S8 family serine peptidase n=1 Tax=unclassified Microcoleus TaxID=2642155 RepID=UPI002FD0C9AB
MSNDFANINLPAFLDRNNLFGSNNMTSSIDLPNNLSALMPGLNYVKDIANNLGFGGNFIDGFGGDDILRGTADSDTVWGNDGNDTLWGDAGQDVLIGGTGSDIFVLQPQQGTDILTDFNLSERDRLGLGPGLTLDELIVYQGTGDNSDSTLIGTKTGDLLAIVKNTRTSAIDYSAFLSLRDGGSVVGQGDWAMRSDIAREQFRVDGTGVKIGVISDSFNRLDGAAADIKSGDLPANVKVLAENTNNNFSPADEGRALLQVIHDIAPGADLLFHTGAAAGEFNSALEFFKANQRVVADGIRSLAAQGAQIIVDDVGLLSEPMFQDGIIAQAIEEVVKKGVVYFTSAGNKARASYQSAFNSAGFLAGVGEFHDFDPGIGVDIYQSITLHKGDSFTISFQWDSPMGRSTNDLDIYLVDSTKQKVLARSTLSNVGGDPIEDLTFRNDGSFGSDLFNLTIAKQSGAAPGLMKYVAGFSATFKINNYNTNSSTAYGNANARGVAAIGAASYLLTPEYGVNPAILEYFSSAGGTPMLFNETGDRLSQPELRPQPSFVAPNNTNTTFFGNDILEDADSFPNFAGTSAAVPHAAAVAALMLQENPYLSPADINRVLAQTALDMDDPNTPGFDVGFDFASGYGLIQADRAIAKIVV